MSDSSWLVSGSMQPAAIAMRVHRHHHTVRTPLIERVFGPITICHTVLLVVSR